MKRLSRLESHEAILLTATRLLDGRIVWRDVTGQWQEHVQSASLLSLEELDVSLATAESGAADQGVMGVYPVVVRRDTPPQPVSMKERIRAFGPTIHPEFAYSSVSTPKLEQSS